MRAFISLELPSKVKKEFGQIQKELQKAGVQARWVNPEIVHLTLAFLGSVAPEKTETIEGVLEEKVAKKIRPVNLILDKIGYFPSPQNPRIISVDLSGELGKLNALAIKTRKTLKKEKIWFDEKPFSPHLTLGRLKRSQNLTQLVKEVKIKKIEFIAGEIALNKSTLTDSGPIYQKLKCVYLE